MKVIIMKFIIFNNVFLNISSIRKKFENICEVAAGYVDILYIA